MLKITALKFRKYYNSTISRRIRHVKMLDSFHFIRKSSVIAQNYGGRGRSEQFKYTNQDLNIQIRI